MTDAHGYKSVDYGRLTPVLVEAMKEQQKQIDELKKDKEKQKAHIDNIERKLSELQEMIKKTSTQ